MNSNPIGAMLVADLTEQQGTAVRETLDGMLRERAGGSGSAVLTDPNHIGIGTVPAGMTWELGPRLASVVGERVPGHGIMQRHRHGHRSCHELVWIMNAYTLH